MTSLPPTFAAKAMTSTCVVWVGATNSRGYGLITVSGKVELAHRVAYEAAHGPIPEGMVIDHLCRVRNCVKVEHLEVVTYAENARRGRAAAALRVGDECINGHTIADESELYVKPSNGATECRHCRRQSAHRPRRPRKSIRLSAAKVTAAVNNADRKAS